MIVAFFKNARGGTSIALLVAATIGRSATTVKRPARCLPIVMSGLLVEASTSCFLRWDTKAWVDDRSLQPRLCLQRHWWLWVPAFAGTTVEAGSEASRCHGFRRDNNNLLHGAKIFPMDRRIRFTMGLPWQLTIRVGPDTGGGDNG